MLNRKLGIIGGSGLYNIDGFSNKKWKKIKTSWKNASNAQNMIFFYQHKCLILE